MKSSVFWTVLWWGATTNQALKNPHLLNLLCILWTDLTSALPNYTISDKLVLFFLMDPRVPFWFVLFYIYLLHTLLDSNQGRKLEIVWKFSLWWTMVLWDKVFQNMPSVIKAIIWIDLLVSYWGMFILKSFERL